MIIYKENDIIKKITPSKGHTSESILHLVPKGCEYKIVDETEKDYQDLSDISPNFDSALTWDLTHDIEKLKELKKEDVLSKIKPEFEKLDVQFLRALEDGADTTEIITRKKELRAKLSNIDACETIDEIKKVKV